MEDRRAGAVQGGRAGKQEGGEVVGGCGERRTDKGVLVAVAAASGEELDLHRACSQCHGQVEPEAAKGGVAASGCGGKACPQPYGGSASNGHKQQGAGDRACWHN